MMLKYSFGLDKESDAIEKAVQMTLEDGYRTGDLVRPGENISEDKKCGCRRMGDLIVERIV